VAADGYFGPGGAAFLPTDGQVNPADITQSLAKGARMRGVKIFEDTHVLGVELDRGRVTAVLTSRGRLWSGSAVNCAANGRDRWVRWQA
jgi:4-methylaminobutanoate oxidase (formaldehyde-forming)